ncbi:MAG: ABC transporter substrate-binding protein, partial [Rhodanobacter sp.]
MRHLIPRLLLATLSCALAFGASAVTKSTAGNEGFLPPWNPPPTGMQFSVPPFDAIADLHGDIVDPQLVVFFAGNQFMVVHDLMAAFKRAHPQYQRIF